MGMGALIMLAFRITLATLVLVCAYLAHAQLKSTTGDDLLCITGRFNNQYPCGLTDPTNTIPSEVTGTGGVCVDDDDKGSADATTRMWMRTRTTRRATRVPRTTHALSPAPPRLSPPTTPLRMRAATWRSNASRRTLATVRLGRLLSLPSSLLSP